MANKNSYSVAGKSEIKEGVARIHHAGSAREREQEIDRVLPFVVALSGGIARKRLFYDREASNDIAQIVAVKFVENLDEISSDWSPAGWVAKTTTNAVNDLLRRRVLEAKYLAELQLDTETDPDQACVSREAREELKRAIDSLPLRERAVVNRRYFYGDKPPEIAASMGLSLNTINGLLTSAKRLLRKALQVKQSNRRSHEN